MPIIPEALREDREVVLAAVKKNGRSLEYAEGGLRADREVVLAAVKQYGQALQFAEGGLEADREVVLAALQQNGLAICYAEGCLRADSEVVLAAVKQNAWAICYAEGGLDADREVVLAAVKQDGGAIFYAKGGLKAEREFIISTGSMFVARLSRVKLDSFMQKLLSMPYGNQLRVRMRATANVVVYLQKLRKRVEQRRVDEFEADWAEVQESGHVVDRRMKGFAHIMWESGRKRRRE